MSYTICSRLKGEHIVYAGYTICSLREHIMHRALCGSTPHRMESIFLWTILILFIVKTAVMILVYCPLENIGYMQSELLRSVTFDENH